MHEVIVHHGPDHGRLVAPTPAVRDLVRLVARADDTEPARHVIVVPTARAREAVHVWDPVSIRYVRQRAGVNWATVELAHQYGFVRTGVVWDADNPPAAALQPARHDLDGVHRRYLEITDAGRAFLAPRSSVVT